ncbi:MAG: hypothetical protein ACF8Q5_14070 [Phycisphaerales bacterium JB040]
MPANRSRTDRWRSSLWKIYERGGGLEFTVERNADAKEPSTDLVWRVRILHLTDDEITIELPGTLGKSFELSAGTRLLGIMAVGQNKWMFHTEVLGPSTRVYRNTFGAIRLAMPDNVERCQRRTFDRISTASVNLPEVNCWPLIDPRSAVPAEMANRIAILDLQDRDITGEAVAPCEDELPQVGPPFNARLANIGGGGIGLQIERSDASALDTCRLFWFRIDLRPAIPAPMALTARLAHTHIDSRQNVYAGFAFDFGLNPSHKGFVLGQIERYMRQAQLRDAA